MTSPEGYGPSAEALQAGMERSSYFKMAKQLKTFIHIDHP